jgi:flagellar assembly protein FliH
MSLSDFSKNQSFSASSWGSAGGDGAGAPNNGDDFRALYSGGEKNDQQNGFVASFLSEEKARAISKAKKKAPASPDTVPPEELESIRQRAYDDAFAQGQAAGLEDGQRQSRELVERLEGIAVHMETAWANLIETHESRIIELVGSAAEKVVYAQAATDQDMVRRAIIEALRVVPEPVNVQIAVNPKDYEFIETVKEDFYSQIKALKDVSVSPDPAIHRGGCNVRTRFGEVDATLESRLEAIRECLMKASGKKAGIE